MLYDVLAEEIPLRCFTDLLFLEAQYIEYQVLAKSEEGFALFTFSKCLNIKML